MKTTKLRRARVNIFNRAIIDAGIALVSVLIAALLRYEFQTTHIDWAPILKITLAMVGLYLLLGIGTGLYLGKYSYGSLEEIFAIALATGITSAATTIFLMTQNFDGVIPRSLAIIAFPIALVLMFAIRYLCRMYVSRTRKPAPKAKPALIIGAGQAGEIMVRTIMNDPQSPLTVVGLVDDDPAKKRLTLHGVPVIGETADIPKLAKQTAAEVLIIAISYANSELLRRLTDLGSQAKLQVLRTPTIKRLMKGPIGVGDLRSISIEDLIGRNTVDTRVDSIAGYIAGKKVLITGAGGSIGSELSLQISKFQPQELIMLDHDESGLQQAQIRIRGNGLLDTREIVLANIREKEIITKIFHERKPEVVFHAAALKHLPVLEQFPAEAWKTNVLGTQNVLEAAMETGVETFVNISTDKAANPTSTLGHSKRVAEKLTAWAAQETGKAYLSVRFGNVIGSRGSMLPTFQTLIERGSPLTVTHPDVTRYFMTIPEACQLVIQAGGIGRPGEVLILDMGEQVKILDVAQRMIEMSGKDIDIVFTGLRQGEKMHEELVSDTEHLERPFHPQISHATADPLCPDHLEYCVWLQRMTEQQKEGVSAQ